MIKRLVTILLGVVVVADAEVGVFNLRVSQREGTKFVDLYFDVSSTETNVVTLSLSVSNGVNSVPCLTVSGDIGEAVNIGADKHIQWDGGADWGGNVGDLLYTIIADDGVSSVIESSSCSVPKSGQSVSYRTGDDGDQQPGEPWPVLRFVDNGDGTVLDELTGLEWVLKPHALPDNSSEQDWDSAIDYCSTLNYAGHTDWRLPNIREMESVVHCGQRVPVAWLNGVDVPFVGLKRGYYWSSTSFAGDTNNAWRVYLYNGYLFGVKKTNHYFVWPVRAL